jgi:tetratricopeptide (TPR) repeat protein
MEGRGRRRNRWVAIGFLVAAATGCNRNATLPDQTNTPVPGDESKSFPEASKYFGQKPANPTAPPPEKVVVKTKRKPGEPLKPQTEIMLAETEIESAYAEGRNSVERDQLLDSARQRYQRALKSEPKNVDALLGLARLYTKTGDKDRAIETYRTAQKAFPKDHGLPHRMAGTQATFGDWDGAVESCRLALTMDPENRTYQKTLGFCLANAGKWDESFEIMARLMPEPEARYFIGRILYDQDKPAEARQQMEAAVRADPRYAVARQFLTDLDAGQQATPATGDGIQAVSHQEPAGQ